jgi:hypothetical protein
MLLGLGIAAVPLATPAQADCIEFTMYVTWDGTDPTGQSTTPVHNGCITEGVGDGAITFGNGTRRGEIPTGLPDGFYLYLRVASAAAQS